MGRQMAYPGLDNNAASRQGRLDYGRLDSGTHEEAGEAPHDLVCIRVAAYPQLYRHRRRLMLRNQVGCKTGRVMRPNPSLSDP